ncbi:hypothetical protein O1R50_15715 [Glycomyces luteolus]|uniref:SHOCT domain-containing protein n=1 Tax=Glycomyces luteolus TaxID=2670330 RepID=A0A9X3SQZ6_9ACTN|nr:hypothetical protein [Glycomyces luteolus]MDA1361077.1 hypothetical protein [Glycomyces luteolus]
MMYGNWSPWMMLMPLLWIGLIALAVWAVIRLTHGRGAYYGPPMRHMHHTHRESPSEILDRRFANGEIDEETYLRMLDRLEGRGGAGP